MAPKLRKQFTKQERWEIKRRCMNAVPVPYQLDASRRDVGMKGMLLLSVQRDNSDRKRIE